MKTSVASILLIFFVFVLSCQSRSAKVSCSLGAEVDSLSIKITIIDKLYKGKTAGHLMITNKSKMPHAVSLQMIKIKDQSGKLYSIYSQSQYSTAIDYMPIPIDSQLSSDIYIGDSKNEFLVCDSLTLVFDTMTIHKL